MKRRREKQPPGLIGTGAACRQFCVHAAFPANAAGRFSSSSFAVMMLMAFFSAEGVGV